jgi:hypothetical protein
MRLEHLCDTEISLDESQAMARPIGGEEGSVFVLGSGTLAGERLHGTARCVNHAHRRNDGVMLPQLSGVIKTDDNASIQFRMHGLTTWRPTTQGPKGDQISWIGLETDAEGYRWLNNARCVVEGTVQIIPGRGATGPCRVYLYVNEML